MSLYKVAVFIAILSLIMNLSVYVAYNYWGVGGVALNTNINEVSVQDKTDAIQAVFSLSDVIKSLLTGNYYLLKDVFHADQVRLSYDSDSTINLALVFSIITELIYAIGILEFLRGGGYYA